MAALRVFISYRREDSRAIAGRIRDQLTNAFGTANVFFDIDTIPFGVDFRQHIDRMVAECDVVLVLIGRRYLDVTDESGVRRLDIAGDFVRLEVEAALRRGIPVVPVLIDGASVPNETQLPPGMGDLAYRNGIEVRYDPDFHTDMDRLIKGLWPSGTLSPLAPPGVDDRAGAAAAIDRAKALLLSGATHEALVEASEAVRLDPTDSMAHTVLGDVRREIEDFNGAEADYDEAIRLDPTNARAFNGRGTVRCETGRVDVGIVDFNQAIRLDPTDSNGHLNRAMALKIMVGATEAEADLDEAIRLDPSNIEALRYRGTLRQTATDDLDGAEADFDEMIRLQPDNDRNWLLRGRLRFERRDPEKRDLDGAIADYDEAIRLRPTWVAYSSRSQARLFNGDKAGSIADKAEADRLA